MSENSIQKTEDGSHTIFSKQFNSTYHSTHGAIQESKHIFIKNGIEYFLAKNKTKNLKIIEYGFGTGLNALLAFEFSQKNKVNINYTALEAYPLKIEIINQLNYLENLNLSNYKNHFSSFHNNDFTKYDNFIFQKNIIDFNNYKTDQKFDIVFFDVFGAETQSELWLRPFLDKVHNIMSDNSILITYGAKGSFKRALKSLDLKIENPEGPPGKREITRAIKKV